MRADAGEPYQRSGVTPFMTRIPINSPEPPERIATDDARAGRTGNKVRYVLMASVLLAVIFMGVAYFGNPDVPDDRPNSAAEAPLR